MMSEVLMFDPTNRKQWDDQIRHLLGLWWLLGGLCLLSIGIAFDNLAQMPQRYVDKRQHDSFVANSVVVRATITQCARIWREPAYVSYEFVPASGISTSGRSIFEGACANYVIGDPLMIRYLPTNPTQSEGIGQIALVDNAFYGTLATIAAAAVNGVVMGYGFIHGLYLNAKGRVRIGRILSTKPFLKHTRLVRYRVTANDGSVLKGWRVMPYRDITPHLVAGAPIPVLYANKYVHWAFGLIVRN